MDYMNNFEFRSPRNIDVLADTIAGAIVDLAYKKETKHSKPLLTVKVLIGKGGAEISPYRNAIKDTSTIKKVHIFIESGGMLFSMNEIRLIVEEVLGANACKNGYFSYNNLEVEQFKMIGDETEKMYLDGYIRQNVRKRRKNRKYFCRGTTCGYGGKVFYAHPITREERKCCKLLNDVCEDRRDGRIVYYGDDLKILEVASLPAKHKDKLILEEGFIFNPSGGWMNSFIMRKESEEIFEGDSKKERNVGKRFRNCSCLGQSGVVYPYVGRDIYDVETSCPIYAFIKSQESGKECKVRAIISRNEYIEISYLNNKWEKVPFKEVIEEVNKFIEKCGGFKELCKNMGLIGSYIKYVERGE